jgi:gliding motility-associated-like protein
MRYRPKYIACCFFIFFAAFCENISAQNCPPNLDFELGDFTNWQCYVGTTSVSGGGNVINVSPTPPILNRHTIISSAFDGVNDPYGNFPVRCPNGSNFSIKLGNNSTGAQAERVSYTFTIPDNQTDYSIIYYYAVVFEDPQHQPSQQPRFTAKVFDVATNSYIGCSTFDYVASSTLPGFEHSFVDPDVWYKTWTPVTINLSGYAGRTIAVEFTTADCTLGGHFGYAYFDVNVGCTTPVLGGTHCVGSDSMTLIAPYGYQNYYWYNNSFSILLGNQPSLILTPPPPIGTVIALDIVPFPGYGCRDTVFTTINERAVPIADAGTDNLICGGAAVNIGSAPVTGMTYSWSPSAGLSSTNIANPIASPTVTTHYVVTIKDLLSGCTGTDTVTVSVYPIPPSAFSIDASSNPCILNNNFVFTNQNPSNLIFLWKFGDGNYSTSYSPMHSYSSVGSYPVTLVSISSEGCRDSTIKNISVYPTPTGSISTSGNYICEGFPTILTGTGGSNYNWYKDGVLIGNTSGSFNALQTGIYTADVITTQGCSNAASNSIALSFVKKPVVDFIFDKYCVELPVNFTNKSNVNGSLTVSYLWNFGNTITSTQVNPTITYGSPGSFDVQLAITPLACPQLNTMKQKTIAIEAPRPGINYFTRNAVINKSLYLSARTFGSNYLWSPSVNLNNPTIISPIFLGTQEQLYQIKILAPSGCTTIDTQLVRIFKEKDIYVPKGFTPNGDGQNDRLYPFLVGIKELRFFRIINRWGVVVYESRMDLPGWNGNYKGIPQPTDGYSWEAEAVDIDGILIRRKGTVTLIR